MKPRIRTKKTTAAALAALALLHADAETVLRRTVDRTTSFDPILTEAVGDMRCVSLVYETLLEYEYATRPYKLKGCVAEALPEVSADGTVLSFRLRRGIMFGPDACLGADPATGAPAAREIVASDVVFSFKRLADAKLSSPGYWTIADKIKGVNEFHAASLTNAPTDYSMDIPGIKALDDHTLQITLEKPSPDFLWVLAMPYTAIVPHEAVSKYGSEFGSHEVGSGPYRLAKWRRGYRIEFRRRAGRDISRDATPMLSDSAGAVPIERIVYLVMEDASTRWLSFLDGALDVMGEISRDNWDAVINPDGTLSDEMKSRGVSLQSKASLDTYYIGFNLDDAVLGPNKKLRQAMSCAFDTAQWEALNRGRIVGATGPVPPGIEGKLETEFQYAFNLDKAKSLLADAGYPEGIDPATGRRLALTLELGRTDQEIRESAELFSAFMGRIGTVVNLQYNNWPSFLRKIARREAQIFLIGWMADYPSALNFLQLFYGGNVSPGPNRANYADPEFDALYNKADATLDDAARIDLMLKMQERLREDCPWIFMHHRKDNLLVNPRVRNLLMHDFPYGAEKHWRVMP